jgi:hypothetical protein
MMPALTVVIIMLIGILIGVGIGFAILWMIWLLLRWTVWRNALLPGDPVDIPARNETPASSESQGKTATG